MKHNINFITVKDTDNRKGKRKDTTCGKILTIYILRMNQNIEYIKGFYKSITKI